MVNVTLFHAFYMHRQCRYRYFILLNNIQGRVYLTKTIPLLIFFLYPDISVFLIVTIRAGWDWIPWYLNCKQVHCYKLARRERKTWLLVGPEFNWQWKQNYSTKPRLNATLSTTNPTCNKQVLNPDPFWKIFPQWSSPLPKIRICTRKNIKRN